MDSFVNIAMALAKGYRAKAQMYHLNFTRCLKSTAKDMFIRCSIFPG